MFGHMVHSLRRFLSFYREAETDEEKLRLADEFADIEEGDGQAILNELTEFELREE